MRTQRTIAAVSALLLAAALAACVPQERVVERSSVAVAVAAPFTSTNPNTSFGATAVNEEIAQATNANFFTVTNELDIKPDPSFGSVEVVSDDPLRVKYTVNEGVTWSDGVALDAADLLLAWAANSGVLNTPGFDDTPYIDRESGRYTDDFPTDVVWFDGRSTSGLQYVTAPPVIGDEGRSVTLEYDRYFVDWKLAFSVGLPAHVVVGASAIAGGAAATPPTPTDSPTPTASPPPAASPTPTDLPSADPKSAATGDAAVIAEAAAAKATVVAAIFAGDQAALAPLSRAWNAGTAVTGGQPLVGSGPYTASVDGAEVTLEANPRYTGDHRPQYETVVVRVIEDPRDAIRALAGGSVDVVAPPASAANGEALLKVRGVTTVEGYDAGFEHLELKFTDSRSGLFGDPLVREAFLKVVPRQQVVDALVGPVQEDARVRSSFMFFPGSEDYTDAVTANGSAAYADVDVAGAQALLAGSAVVAGTAPQVCVLFDPTDPRRVAEFALLQQSAAPAGFIVTDCSRDDWESILTVPGAWDAALVDWPATARPVTGAVERLRSDAPANASGYASTTTDALLDRLGAERDASERGKILADVDTQLFADFYGMPLFQLPSLTAYRSDVEGIARSPLSPNLFWNLWEWHPAPSD